MIDLKQDKIIGGIVLIAIGIIFLLVNLGYISWSIFLSILDLWPLILIAIGLNIMFKGNRIISAITWIVFFVVFIGYGVYYQGGISYGNGQQLVINNNPQIVTGELNLKLGGTSFNINDSMNKLIDATYDSSYYKADTRYSNNNTHANITVEGKSGRFKFVNFNRRSINSFFNLNKDVVWDIRADVGAVKGTLDLSDLKINNLKIGMGAGNLDIIFGDKHTETKAKIDSGASNLDIYIRDGVGAKIRVQGALNNTNIKSKGWQMIDEYYITPGYDEAESKLILDISAGVANITIHR